MSKISYECTVSFSILTSAFQIKERMIRHEKIINFAKSSFNSNPVLNTLQMFKRF